MGFTRTNPTVTETTVVEIPEGNITEIRIDLENHRMDIGVNWGVTQTDGKFNVVRREHISISGDEFTALASKKVTTGKTFYDNFKSEIWNYISTKNSIAGAVV